MWQPELIKQSTWLSGWQIRQNIELRVALSCKLRVESFSARLKLQIGPSDMKRAESHMKQVIEFIWYSIDKMYSIVLNFVVHYIIDY